MRFKVRRPLRLLAVDRSLTLESLHTLWQQTSGPCYEVTSCHRLSLAFLFVGPRDGDTTVTREYGPWTDVPLFRAIC